MPAVIKAGVAQSAERLICNQQVGSSILPASSTIAAILGVFPSGQRGQTVNLLASLSEVRILQPPLVETSVNLKKSQIALLTSLKISV